MHMKVAIFFALLLLPVATTFADVQNDLQEVNQKFTYHAKPIHPGLVQEFSSWISDPGMSATISVDVVAEHGNEYSALRLLFGLRFKERFIQDAFFNILPGAFQ